MSSALYKTRNGYIYGFSNGEDVRRYNNLLIKSDYSISYSPFIKAGTFYVLSDCDLSDKIAVIEPKKVKNTDKTCLCTIVLEREFKLTNKLSKIYFKLEDVEIEITEDTIFKFEKMTYINEKPKFSKHYFIENDAARGCKKIVALQKECFSFLNKIPFIKKYPEYIGTL